MNFKMQQLKLDMGTTPFENMFLNTYVQMADGDALKVYLLIYKDIYNDGEVNIEKIKKQLNFDDEKFNDAINYRINMGAFKEKKDLKGNTYLEVVSIRQMYFGDSEKVDKNELNFDIAGRKAIMFENIERIIDRNLTPSDITRIHETINEYNSDPELVTEAFREAKEIGNVDVKYVMGFVKSWRDQNITTLNELKIHQERQKIRQANSPRQYKRNNKPISKNSKGYAQKAREARFKKMMELGGENDS